MGLRDLFGMSTKHEGQHQAGKHSASGKAKAAKQPRQPKSQKGKK